MSSPSVKANSDTISSKQRKSAKANSNTKSSNLDTRAELADLIKKKAETSVSWGIFGMHVYFNTNYTLYVS